MSNLQLDERDDAYVIHGELPGFSRSDIDVHIEARTLRVRGDRRESRDGESSEESFSESYALPEDASLDRMKTDLRDGSLTVQVPRS